MSKQRDPNERFFLYGRPAQIERWPYWMSYDRTIETWNHLGVYTQKDWLERFHTTRALDVKFLDTGEIHPWQCSDIRAFMTYAPPRLVKVTYQ